ncbi:hypothetical protein ACIBTV_27675 [Micromonospora sp. NPDC049366]|uniref:hypothetical protein n=1 Tax=Micromonospora sp. NPDC049366 TaxID=3364271 RepID=UPI003795217A
MRRLRIRRYAVTIRQPGHPLGIASRHLTMRAATRRADWLRRLSRMDGADVRAEHLDNLKLDQ